MNEAKYMNEWLYEWKFMNWSEYIDMNEKYMNEWMDGWMHGWMNDWIHWNEKIGIKELKWRNWSEWIDMNEVTWMTWNKWIDMKELKCTNWCGWIDLNELTCMSWNELKWKNCPKVLQTPRFFFLRVFTWNRALATVSIAFCRPLFLDRGAKPLKQRSSFSDRASHFIPKKITRFGARECLQALSHAFSISYASQLLDDDAVNMMTRIYYLVAMMMWLTWWLRWWFWYHDGKRAIHDNRQLGSFLTKLPLIRWLAGAFGGLSGRERGRYMDILEVYIYIFIYIYLYIYI